MTSAVSSGGTLQDRNCLLLAVVVIAMCSPGLLHLHGPGRKLKHLSLHSNRLGSIEHLLQCLLGLQGLSEVLLSHGGKDNPLCTTPGETVTVITIGSSDVCFEELASLWISSQQCFSTFLQLRWGSRFKLLTTWHSQCQIWLFCVSL